MAIYVNLRVTNPGGFMALERSRGGKYVNALGTSCLSSVCSI